MSSCKAFQVARGSTLPVITISPSTFASLRLLAKPSTHFAMLPLAIIAFLPVSDGMNKKFNFTVEVTCPGYTPVDYSFTVPLTSEKIESVELNSTYSVKIQDIFLFKADEK